MIQKYMGIKMSSFLSIFYYVLERSDIGIHDTVALTEQFTFTS